MKRFLRMMLSVFVVIAMMYPGFSALAQDVSFDITKQDITAEIRSDGSVQFTDIQYYDINYINGALFTLDAENYQVSHYEVGIIDPNTQEPIFFPENTTGSPETYLVNENNGTYEFRVYYPAADEQVAFVYQYTIDALVTNYNDTAELNRQIVGTGTNDVMDVTAEIILPAVVANPEDFRTWAQGAPQGEIQQSERDGHSIAVINVPNNPANQFVEVQILFPTAMTPNNPNVVDQDRKQLIIDQQEEGRLAELQAYESSRSNYVNWLIVIIVAIFIGPVFAWWYYLSRRKKLNPNPIHVPEHVYHLPEDITPAVMATSVYRTKPNNDDFAATILDLARKGYIKLEEVRKEKRGFLSGDSSTIRISLSDEKPDVKQLHKHEQYAYDFVKPKGSEKSITFEQIEKEAKADKTYAKRLFSNWTRFENFVSIRGQQLRDPQKEQTYALLWATLALFASISLMVVGIILAVSRFSLPTLMWTVIGLGVVGIVASFVLLIRASNYPIQTQASDHRQKEWHGFANMLKDIGNFNMREIATIELWEEYLVYAVSLGVADKVVEAMNLNFSQTELNTLHMGPTIYAYPHMITSSMSRSVQQSVQSSAPASSNYSGSNVGGFGGGFGGGSSGGSGGGSGSGGF
ncbi:DUF2207 domain-containing protein [Fundicoccus culcitae]|uniref:DUF2207 domain-containing protein n=1 Tax=Fundicoccus culcitae TaxID=2969821 RepID=A0ABY5P3E1_9LACT|nr:DUF2207 domain-containing protein [Fundicoccus culcitae]UUX33242.1 DUF2207 domain-containing protein [Fundicoccus culcitae]